MAILHPPDACSLHPLPPLAAEHPESSIQILLCVQLCSFLPTGMPSLQSQGGEGGGGAGPLGNVLLETR